MTGKSKPKSKGLTTGQIPLIKGLATDGYALLGSLCQDNVARLPEMMPAKPGTTLAPYYLWWVENDMPYSAVLEQALLTCIKNAPWGRPIYIDKEARAKTPLKEFTLAETINHFGINVSKRRIIGGELMLFPRPNIGPAKLTIPGKQYLAELDDFYGYIR